MPGAASWPKGTRVIVRNGRRHPGAQLRFTDIGGTGSPALPPAPAAGSSLISNSGIAAGPVRRTGPAARKRHRPATTVPHHGYAQNQIRCEIVAGLRTDRLDADARPARTGPPLGTADGCGCELFTAAARLVRGGRRIRVRLAQRWPSAQRITTAIDPPRSAARPADQPKTIQRPGRTLRASGSRPPGTAAGPKR